MAFFRGRSLVPRINVELFLEENERFVRVASRVNLARDVTDSKAVTG